MAERDTNRRPVRVPSPPPRCRRAGDTGPAGPALAGRPSALRGSEAAPPAAPGPGPPARPGPAPTGLRPLPDGPPPPTSPRCPPARPPRRAAPLPPPHRGPPRQIRHSEGLPAGAAAAGADPLISASAPSPAGPARRGAARVGGERWPSSGKCRRGHSGTSFLPSLPPPARSG